LLKNTRKAQTWSFDLIIAVVLFIVVVAVFYSFLSADTYQDATSRLESGAELIINQLDCDAGGDDEVCIITKGEVTEASLEKLGIQSYDQVKTSLGVTGEFCIYLRATDGTLVPFPNDLAGVGKNTTTLFETDDTQINCGELIS
jgi:hypothetical protein